MNARWPVWGSESNEARDRTYRSTPMAWLTARASSAYWAASMLQKPTSPPQHCLADTPDSSAEIRWVNSWMRGTGSEPWGWLAGSHWTPPTSMGCMKPPIRTSNATGWNFNKAGCLHEAKHLNKCKSICRRSIILIPHTALLTLRICLASKYEKVRLGE